jgi:hypothetical protein
MLEGKENDAEIIIKRAI